MSDENVPTTDKTLYTGPVLLAAGGTGGHMFPAQALAQELKRRGHRVVLMTDSRGMVYTRDFPADEIIELSAANPNQNGLMAKINAAAALMRGVVAAIGHIKRIKPIAAIGFGGYPSVTGLQAASLMTIPYGVHEQNSLLGRANRLMARKAKFLAHAFPVLGGVPETIKAPLYEVGNPVRDDVQVLANTPFHLPAENLSDGAQSKRAQSIEILITGGSQGASLFSQIPVQAFSSLPNHLRDRVHITHQVRANDKESVIEAYEEAGISYDVADFFTDLPEKIAKAHLIIARSGASTVTEIATIGRPAIFIPLAIAMDDHQTQNARVLSEAEAAIVLPEKEFTYDTLRIELERLITNPALLTAMAKEATTKVKPNATLAMAQLIEDMIEADRA